MYEIFEQLLQSRNLSSYKLSKDTGISQTTLSNWKNGHIQPKQDKMQIIADYFNVSLDYLMGREKSISVTMEFDTDEEASIFLDIMSCIEKFNINGMKESKRYLNYLVSQDENIAEKVELLNAAHERTDIKATFDDKTYDEHLMNDDKNWD